MVYLQPALRARRSAQASALSQSQQAMGVTPPAAPPQQSAPPPAPSFPSGGGGGGVPTGQPGGFAPQVNGGSRVQALLMQQKQQRDMLQARGNDLRLANLLSMALDPSVPKGFRQLGLRNISQTLGIDPRGDRAKDIINTLSSLDPQSLEGIRRGVISSTNDAQPGELTDMTRGVLTGQVPPDQLLQLARGALQPPSAPESAPGAEADAGGGYTGDVGGGDGPPMRLGGLTIAAPGQPSVSPSNDVTPVQAPGQAPLPGAPLPPRPGAATTLPDTAAPAPMIPVLPEANIPPRMREANPGIVNAFGLDPTVRYRNQDLIAGGWTRVPLTEAEANTALKDISGSQEGAISTMRMIAQLSALVGNRPEVLGTGDIGHPTDRQGLLNSILNGNPSAMMDEINNTIRSMGYAVGTGTDWLDRIAPTDPLYDTEVGRAIRDTADKLTAVGGIFHSPERMQEAATTNARIRAVLVPLAFAMAAAQGQTGRFLSDRDVALQLQSLGNSRSPQQFQAALSETANRIYNSYNTRMRAQFGGPVPLEYAVNDNDRAIITSSDIIPRQLVNALGGALTQQPTAPAVTPPANRPAPEAAYPNGPPNRSMLPGGQPLPPLPEPGAEATPAPGAPPAAAATEPPAPPTPIARRSLTRTGPTLEAEGQAAIQRAQEDRALRLAENARQQRLLQIAESSEARAQREEVERRRERIRQAFAQIGQSLRGAISANVGVMGADTSGQDAGAFRMAVRPQGRGGPTPVNAAPYQPQPGRTRVPR